MNIRMGQENTTGLEAMVEKYGFKVNKDFIFDTRNAPGPVNMRGQIGLANYPTFPISEVPEAKDFMVVEGVQNIIMPFASSVDLVGPLASGAPEGSQLWPSPNHLTKAGDTQACTS